MEVRNRYDTCVRCGKAVPYGESVCRECNPARLPAPSPAQYHATVFLAVFIALGIIALIVFLT
jgi:predicted nucleic acid-binding Zn ribbon protein